tara:strand:+ start:1606 stop:1911 length:306 start_codon:yes stop_codon:yes gene_type:complete
VAIGIVRGALSTLVIHATLYKGGPDELERVLWGLAKVHKLSTADAKMLGSPFIGLSYLYGSVLRMYLQLASGEGTEGISGNDVKDRSGSHGGVGVGVGVGV